MMNAANKNFPIEFCGNIFAPVPTVAFELFDWLQQDSSLADLIISEESRSSVTYHRKARVYTTHGGGKEIMPENALVFLDLSYDVSTEAGVFRIGLGIASDPTQRDNFNNMLSFIANDTLRATYVALKVFLETNAGKYEGNAFCPTEWCSGTIEESIVSALLSSLGRCIVLDTEMQGDRLIQFAGRIFCWDGYDFIQQDELSLYVQLPPGERILPKIWELTSITDALLYYKGEPLRSALPRIRDFLASGDIIVGQATKCDLDVLTGAFLDEGLDVPDVLNQDVYIDIAPIFRFLHGRKGNTSLKNTADVLGVSTEGMHFHDAAVDAFITSEIFKQVVVSFVKRTGVLPIIDYWMDVKPERKNLLLIPPTYRKSNPTLDIIRRNTLRELGFEGIN